MGEVFVMDTQAPVTLAQTKRDSKMPYVVLYVLLSIAVTGVMVQSALIYHLYHRSAPQQVFPEPPQREQYKGDAPSHVKSKSRGKMVDKPAAFLHGNKPQVDKDGVMQWQTQGVFAFLRNVTYHNGYVQVQVDGFYDIFSKVYFKDGCSGFTHQVMWTSPRYSNESVVIMRSIRKSCPLGQMGQEEEEPSMDNSYLGGVFQLSRNDRVFVKVLDRSSVQLGLYDNFFGLFII